MRSSHRKGLCCAENAALWGPKWNESVILLHNLPKETCAAESSKNAVLKPAKALLASPQGNKDSDLHVPAR
jgi:hypothetical protein